MLYTYFTFIVGTQSFITSNYTICVQENLLCEEKNFCTRHINFKSMKVHLWHIYDGVRKLELEIYTNFDGHVRGDECFIDLLYLQTKLRSLCRYFFLTCILYLSISIKSVQIRIRQ